MSMQRESPLRLQCFDQSQTWLPILHLLLTHISPPVTAQPVAPVVEPASNKSVVTIMAIVAVMFLISGFLSLYSRKCGERQEQARGTLNHALPTGATGNQSQTEPNGLSEEIIETFPTFLYSNVKGLKIGNDTLACAVCLNEFEDDESLRLIPKCCHVYHLACIDVWFASHTTCPLCRANLVPKPDDVEMNVNEYLVSTIPDGQEREQEDEYDTVIGYGDEDQKRDDDVESPKVLLRRIRTMNRSRPLRSKSTGFLSALQFPRSNSMGQLALPVENFERYTLRLPEEVRSQMLNSTLKRANSCVCFTRMSSGMWGYRTRSVGSGRGKGHALYERFGTTDEQSGFGLSLTPPRLVKSSWNRSGRKSSPVQCSGGVALDHNNNNVGERSTDFLRLG